MKVECATQWLYGAIHLWLLPHSSGSKGEPQARVLLAQALELAPDTLPLARDARGRPYLLPPLAHIDAGWSHSGGQLLVAMGKGVRLGVDMEMLRPRPRMREVAQRFFHPQETSWLAEMGDDDYAQWFFRLWCAKEALLKAYGHGIAFGLHRLRFAECNRALQLVWCDQELGEAALWHLYEWQAKPGYRAALAWYPNVVS